MVDINTKEDNMDHGHACAEVSDAAKPVECNWSMFEKVKELGGGAFGQVYKVKCLVSTKICDAGGERVPMRTKSVKHTKSQ